MQGGLRTSFSQIEYQGEPGQGAAYVADLQHLRAWDASTKEVVPLGQGNYLVSVAFCGGCCGVTRLRYQVQRDGACVVRMLGQGPGTQTRETYVFIPLPGERVRLTYRYSIWENDVLRPPCICSCCHGMGSCPI